MAVSIVLGCGGKTRTPRVGRMSAFLRSRLQRIGMSVRNPEPTFRPNGDVI